ncbi:MAG: hypothetical protein LUE17_02185 [Planctomycetaceae bacterium]|nr:hypothetical protein [Planctomycetaceae bacterium]
MRSKIGTKSRLAAHILALILLIVLLVYGVPPQPSAYHPLQPSVSIPPEPTPAAEAAPVQPVVPEEMPPSQPPVPPEPAVVPIPVSTPVAPADPTATLDRIHSPADGESMPTGALRPPEPAAEPAPLDETPAPADPEPVPEELPEEAIPVEPMPEDAAPLADETVPTPVETLPEPEPAAEPIESLAVPEESAVPEETDEPISEPAPQAGPEPVAPAVPDDAETTEQPAAAQPDESGSLVVAAPETGEDAPVPATAPLPRLANLEVLGDGVYWLDSGYDLEKELAAIPEIGTLVFLSPLPDHQSTGFEHVKTESIPADLADLDRDAAERYLHITSAEAGPVVTAVLPGARGAAFFKGAFLLANRKLDMEEVLRELEPELESAGEARDEIIHRLIRLQD